MSDSQCDLLCIDFDHAEALRQALPPAPSMAPVVERLRALSDPTRLRLVQVLQVGGELCVCDLAWVIGSSQQLVSHHLRQLRAAGLVTSRKDGKLVMYQLSLSGSQFVVAVTPTDTETLDEAVQQTPLPVGGRVSPQISPSTERGRA